MAQSLVVDPSSRSQTSNSEELLALGTSQSIATWYQPSLSQSNPLASAHAAYTAATQHFSTYLTRDECKRIWLVDKTSMQDVIAAVESAKLEYEMRSRKGKIREYLVAFSSRVMYYGSIMDSLSQHHPEYVALAWGTMKFLFVGLLNHEELLSSIAKTLCRIADVLPRVELDVSLYGNPLILTAVSKLYAQIIKFVQYAVRWYQKGKIAHGLASILQPFQITAKEMVEEITHCSRFVDQLAMSANRAETRAMHLRILELTRLTIENRTLHVQMSTDVRDIRDSQMAQILVLPSIKSLPMASQNLAYQIAVRNRDRARGIMTQGHPHLLPALQNWATQGSDLLLIEGKKDSKGPKYLATDIIEEISRGSMPIMWALSEGHAKDKTTSLVDILRLLTLQALKIPRTSLNEHMLITPAEIEGAVKSEDWLSLLQRALRGLKEAFIIIDTDILRGGAIRDYHSQAIGLMRRLMKECWGNGVYLKIILTARQFLQVVGPNEDEVHAPVRLHTETTSVATSRYRSRYEKSHVTGRGSTPRGGRGRPNGSKRSPGAEIFRTHSRGPARENDEYSMRR